MRKSPIAGSWYPGTSGEIKGLVNKFLDDTELPEIKTRPVGMIAPHAGIQFSGHAAAYGYKAVKGLDIDRVIIMGPSHYFPFRGVAVSGEDMYETPMGKVEVDKKITDDLYGQPLFEGPRNAEIQEHSLEMQLPFLQVVLDDFKIVPLVVGDVSGSEYEDIAREIKRVADENTLIIASSDFTHYGGRFGYVPFQRDIKKNLEDLDLGAIERIVEGDFNGYALELKPESDRFFTSVVYLPYADVAVKETNKAEKVAYTIHKKIAIAIDNSSHNIPEVRAGPVAA